MEIGRENHRGPRTKPIRRSRTSPTQPHVTRAGRSVGTCRLRWPCYRWHICLQRSSKKPSEIHECLQI
jgi:hypothetical protein